MKYVYTALDDLDKMLIDCIDNVCKMLLFWTFHYGFLCIEHETDCDFLQIMIQCSRTRSVALSTFRYGFFYIDYWINYDFRKFWCNMSIWCGSLFVKRCYILNVYYGLFYIDYATNYDFRKSRFKIQEHGMWPDRLFITDSSIQRTITDLLVDIEECVTEGCKFHKMCRK